jgi:hypothetical protein
MKQIIRWQKCEFTMHEVILIRHQVAELRAVNENQRTEAYVFLESFTGALRATDYVDFMILSYRDAVWVVRRTSMTVVVAHLDLARSIYFKTSQEKDKATRQWEKFLNMYSSAKEEGEIGMAKVIASSDLAPLWLCNAVAAREGSATAEEYLSRQSNW